MDEQPTTTPEDQPQDPASSQADPAAPESTTPEGQPATPENEQFKADDVEPETRQAKKSDAPASPTKDTSIPADPGDTDAISKMVDQKLEGVSEQLKEMQRIKDEMEVDSFLKSKPEFSKYRDVMVKYIQHPAYSQIPVHNIAAIVASRDLQKMGAQKEREAAQKAKETQSPGSAARKPTATIDWSTASKEEFEAHKAKVLGQG